MLKAGEATDIKELIEKPETEMSSSEIVAALFRFELTGKGQADDGGRMRKN